MSYTLSDFCDDVRSILGARDDRDARERVRQKLELLLVDPTFRAEYLGPDEAGVRQIYQDPDLHFCVLAYNMAGSRTSPPHDHGESWAVYGQADGATDMTVWSLEDGVVRPIRSFRLEPGQAGLFDVGEIHSIHYADGAKFVRVTGTDLSGQPQRVFDPETGQVRHSERVGTQPARQVHRP